MSEEKPQVPKVTIYTEGQKVDGLPFMGEQMVCCVCGRKKTSDPRVHTNWRAFQVDGETYYACTAEFPPDNASAGKFKRAYARVMKKIMALRGGTVN